MRAGVVGLGSMARRIHLPLLAVRALEQVRLDGDGPPRSLGPGPWPPVAERRGFTALVDHVLGSLEDPDACSVAARRVLPAHQLAEELLR